MCFSPHLLTPMTGMISMKLISLWLSKTFCYSIRPDLQQEALQILSWPASHECSGLKNPPFVYFGSCVPVFLASEEPKSKLTLVPYLRGSCLIHPLSTPHCRFRHRLGYVITCCPTVWTIFQSDKTVSLFSPSWSFLILLPDVFGLILFSKVGDIKWAAC